MILCEYWERHPEVRSALQAWYADASHAAWKSPSEIKRVYVNASILPNNRVVFNIKGNHYRLVVAVQYNYGIFLSALLAHILNTTRSKLPPFEITMEIKPIRTEADYEVALKEVERLFDAVPGTPEGDQLDVLTTLSEILNRRHPLSLGMIRKLNNGLGIPADVLIRPMR